MRNHLRTLVCLLSVCCALGQANDWRLAEIPAEVIVNPTGTLSKPRPYQGTPSSVVSKSGKRLFTVWYGNGTDEGLENYLMLAYSDSQLEDSPIKLVVRSAHLGKVRCFDAALWREPSGRVYLGWTQSTDTYIFDTHLSRWNRRGPYFCIYTNNPDDPEPTWSAPRKLFDGVMINKPAFLKNGDILYPVAVFQFRGINDELSKNEGLWLYRSRDQGKTIEKIMGLFVYAHGLESIILEKKDGTLWYLARVEPFVRFYNYNRPSTSFIRSGVNTDGIYEAVSKDNGKSFTRLKPSKIPHVGSRFHISRLQSGNLLLVKNYANDELWLAGKPKARDGEGDKDIDKKPRERKRMIAYISTDDGKTWQGGLELDERTHVAYPDASQADNGDIYITWDFNRYKDAEICAAKLTEQDILAKKIVSKNSIRNTVISRGADTRK